MSGPDNRFQALARDAAQRIADSRELAEQLSLLPDERPGAALVEDGRAKRGQGKALNQMREWLAARGYRQPEDVLAEMAGLASRESTILTVMAEAEQILAWAGKGTETATMRQRLETFMQAYTLALRAAEVLMPYGAPKITPDAGANTVVNTIVVQGSAPAAPARGADQARDVTPSPRRIAPPPLPNEIQSNQMLGDAVASASDSEARTE